MMTEKRRIQLETTDEQLTVDEIEGGYHFCADFDFLVVGPDSPEWALCSCGRWACVDEDK